MAEPTRPPSDPQPPQEGSWRATQRSVVATILCIVFLGAGISKQIARDYWVETFTGLGMPDWTMHAVGLVEMTAAILVLIPATRLVGAGLIGIVMLGAVATHLLAGQFVAVLVPLAMLVLAGLLFGPLRPPVRHEEPTSAPPPAHATR